MKSTNLIERILRIALTCLLAISTTAQSGLQPEVRTLGRGTPGSVGVPQLAMFGSPVLGNPFALYVENVAPGSVGSMFVSTQELPIPLAVFGVVTYPGVPLVALPFVADADGRSPRFVEQLPTPASLVGARIVAQGLVLDATAQGGVAFTAAVRVRVGDEATGTGLRPRLVTGLGMAYPVRGDFDGNGYQDLVEISMGYPIGGLFIQARLMGPDFGFEIRTTLTNEMYDFPWGVTSGDFDQDGNLDLVALIDSGQGQLPKLYRGQGNGEFAQGELLNLPTPGYAGAWTVDSHDWDGDGLLDLVVGSAIGRAFQFYHGVGGAQFTFAFEVPPVTPLANRTTEILFDDLNADGQLDALMFWTNGAGVMLGTAPGQFQPAFDPGPNPGYHYFHPHRRGFALADLDEDGLLDLIGGAAVYIGIGDGTFSAELPFAAPSEWLTHATVGDIDSDGHIDLVASVHSGCKARTFLGDGTGSLVEEQCLQAGCGSNVLHDFNHDGILDIASGPFLRPGDGTGRFLSPLLNSETAQSGYAISTAAADLNSDGLVDQVTVTSAATYIAYRNREGLQNQAGATDLAGGTRVRLAHLDGDGHWDKVVASRTDSVVRVALGDGQGAFQLSVDYAVGAGSRDVAVADIDGNGTLDLVTANDGLSALSILFGLGDGTFGAGTSLTIPAAAYAIESEDIDADGDMDLVATLREKDRVIILENQGAGAFTAPWVLETPSDPAQTAVGQLDGTGGLDLVVACTEAGVIAVYLNSVGSTTVPTYQLSTLKPAHVRLADFTGDGVLDLTANQPIHGVTTFAGDGLGRFGSARPALYGSSTFEVVDWNRDLVPDLVYLVGRSPVSLANQLLR